MLGPTAVVSLIAMISCTVAANLLMKLGATTPAAERLFFGIVDWKMAMGVAMFACGAILYAVLLETIPLNVVQSFAAAQFVAVIVAANHVLAEPISPARWAGILLIATGIFIAGMTA